MSTTHSNSSRLETLRAHFTAYSQAHVFDGLDSLDSATLDTFLDQLASIDLEEVKRLLAGEGIDNRAGGTTLEPAPFVPRASTEARHHRANGETLIRAGHVAAFTVAGGQGTRLGWLGPKGTFPATPHTNKPLFQLFAEQLKATGRAYDVMIPWYVMTSPLNDAETRAFFEAHSFFGLDPDSVMLFPQGVMPAVDEAGRLLLERPGHLAVSPDGHGGSLRALARSGALADMKRRGITTISYFQVDNPTVHAIDPVFLGLHAASEGSSAEMSSKMVPKCAADEKVGVFCAHGDGVCVIEYSDLDPALAEARHDHGALCFIAGSIALHAIGVAFVERLTAEDSSMRLPFHLAKKKIPFWDPHTNTLVEPTHPNGTKFEMFVFDALAFASRSIVLETDRVEEFAPIKNAEGSDSAASSAALQIERAARWIEYVGGSVPRRSDGVVDASIEIQASTALEAADLAGTDVPEIAAGSSVTL